MIEVRNLTKKYRELIVIDNSAIPLIRVRYMESWERMERAKVRCSDVLPV